MDSDFWTSRLAAAKRQYTLQHQHQSYHLDRLNIDDFEVEDDQVRPDFPCPYCYEDFDIASLCSHLEEEHSCESKVTRVMFHCKVSLMFSVMVKNGIINVIRLVSYGLWHFKTVTYYAGNVIESDTIRTSYSWMVQNLQKSLINEPATFNEDTLFVSLKLIVLGLSHLLYYLQRRRRLRRVAIPNSQALSLLGRDLREAHLQVLLGGGGYRSNSANVSNAATDPFLSSLILNFPTSEAEEISKSVVTSVEDTAAKNAAPAHIWKSSFDPSLSREERERRMKQAAGRAGFVQDLLLSTLSSD
ncbi:hypothetical protein JRO89_XS06G0065800 [Xanthoceras sorbifolium]|uniref:Protein dehydration-induced 19 C-terminal domain-containing protein n=1 Tax=Xanthoceras sorbifolium TaxID=99658 RepID=A0ABQ8HX31_9ROSI|nr:hypothetical protein JRO89_XS06G0065800 [Xanthoceras sorbifolium]